MRLAVCGICCIHNLKNGQCLFTKELNLQRLQNRFSFSAAMGEYPHFRPREDWKNDGPDAFVFEILKTIEQKPEQTRAEFLGELDILYE